MRLRIIKPGLMSTIQDMGRILYLSQAVPVSGAMDMLSARLANITVGNDEHDAVIELTYAGAEFVAETAMLIAYAGDGAILTAGTQQLPPEKPLFIPAGTTIRLISNPAGSRTYLAVAGGWDVPLVLGSRSTYITAALGGMQGRALLQGDLLKHTGELSPVSVAILNSLSAEGINYPHWGLPIRLLLPADRKAIRIVPAHEFNWFDSRSVIDFLTTSYTLGINSNRMGYHLDGAPINRLVNDELLSTAVTPGTIQVTGNGSMILLMADCQTTGGYPRIAQVAAVDLPLCGQLKPGDAINFKDITAHEAGMLYIELEKQLQKLSIAVKSRFY
ncbi:MAG: biotin-dependent carboxyltransferase family protein [Mucilaginibacter sp.]